MMMEKRIRIIVMGDEKRRKKVEGDDGNEGKIIRATFWFGRRL
jgi:hypothetical protein